MFCQQDMKMCYFLFQMKRTKSNHPFSMDQPAFQYVTCLLINELFLLRFVCAMCCIYNAVVADCH